jgi:hypothetical protein
MANRFAALVNPAADFAEDADRKVWVPHEGEDVSVVPLLGASPGNHPGAEDEHFPGFGAGTENHAQRRHDENAAFSLVRAGRLDEAGKQSDADFEAGRCKPQ